MGFEIAVILLFILINGFFSLSEMAIVSSRKARLRQKAEDGNAGAKLALATAENPGRFLSTVQIVITLMGTIAGAFGGATVAEELAVNFAGFGMDAELAESVAFGLVVLCTTFLSVVLGELVPKNLALANPEGIAGFVSYPMRFFSFLFAPVVRVLTGTTDLVLKLFGAKHEDNPAVTEEEVKVLISQGTEMGIFDAREKEMFEGILYLGDKKVTAFMTPRPDLVYLDTADSDADQIARIIELSDFDTVPVAREDLDHIEGIVSVKAVLAAMAKGPVASLAAFIRKPHFVPESMGALNLFTILKQDLLKVAYVIDEYGGVSGLVTFADLVEAILGEIAVNPGEGEETEITRRDDGSYFVDGGLSVDDFVERFDLDHDSFSDSYETVAGFVLDRIGRIPKAGDSFAFGSWKVEIADMDGNRVDKLILTPIHDEGKKGAERD